MLLELVGMCGIAVTQPVLSIFGSSPLTFLALGAGPLVLALFCAGVALLPAALLLGIGQLGRLRGADGRRWVHWAELGALAGLTVARAAKQAGSGSVAILAVGLVAAALFVVVLQRVPPMRDFAPLLSIAAVLFVALFFLQSSVGQLFRLGEHPVVGEPTTGPHPPVVVVVFDEFPLETLLDDEGGIHPVAYPALHEFVDGASWYRNTTTSSTWTRVAVPTLLSGRFPTDVEVLPTASNFPHSLFNVLGGDYAMHVTEPYTRVCAPSLCDRTEVAPLRAVGNLLGEAARVWGDAVHPTTQPMVTFDAAVATDLPTPDRSFRDFIADLGAHEASTLHLLHVELPHQPWRLDASGEPYDASHPAPGLDVDTTWVDEASADDARRRHVLQTAATDGLLGKLFDELRAQGMYDEAMIVITADHGVNFEAGHDVRGISDPAAPGTLWVPLFVKYPDQARGEIVDLPAATVDLLPTIAAVAGTTVPDDADLDGVDLRTLSDPDRSRRFVATFKDEWPHGAPIELPTVPPRALIDGDRSPELGDVPGWAPYQHGPFAALVGDRTPEDRVAGTAVPGQGGGLRSVDGDLLPLEISGWIDEGAPGDWVVVEVNGVLAGTSALHPASGGRRRFHVVVSSAPWPSRGNAMVRVLVAAGDADAPLLTPVAG
jgi:hypothetical protein